MPSPRPASRHDFGRRVRTARAYASVSQSELAAGIAARFPDAAVSPATIKRLENDDLGVKGSVYEWASRIAPVTGVPEWFLVGSWTGAAEVLEVAIPDQEVALENLRKSHVRAKTEVDRAHAEQRMSEQRFLEARMRLQRIAEEEQHLRKEQEVAKASLERLLTTYRPRPTPIEVKKRGEDLAEFIADMMGRPEEMRELAERLEAVKEGGEEDYDDDLLFEAALAALPPGSSLRAMFTRWIEHFARLPMEVEEAKAAEADITPRARRPSSPGGGGSGASAAEREHLTNTGDREQSQTPEEPDARADTG